MRVPVQSCIFNVRVDLDVYQYILTGRQTNAKKNPEFLVKGGEMKGHISTSRFKCISVFISKIPMSYTLCATTLMVWTLTDKNP